nr:uncharacterized protein LOC112078427 [Salvelinus alpinus]
MCFFKQGNIVRLEVQHNSGRRSSREEQQEEQRRKQYVFSFFTTLAQRVSVQNRLWTKTDITDTLLIIYDSKQDTPADHLSDRLTEKQKQVGEKQQKSQQRIQEREKEMQELRQAVDSLKFSAQAAVDDSERIFAELIRTMETRGSEVKELIRAQEKAEVSQAEGLLERLEQEVAELRRRDAELEQFSHTEDNIHFLQRFKDHSAPPVSEEMPAIILKQSHVFKTVMTSDLQKQLMLCCKKGVVEISAAVKAVHILQSAEPSTRAPEQQHLSHNITKRILKKAF